MIRRAVYLRYELEKRLRAVYCIVVECTEWYHNKAIERAALDILMRRLSD